MLIFFEIRERIRIFVIVKVMLYNFIRFTNNSTRLAYHKTANVSKI